MRTERGWCDITIRNVSSGGFMAQCNSPPRRGYYVEVWRGEVCIIGYVVWSSGARFGARSQEKVDIPALLANRPAKPRCGERRKRDRGPHRAPLTPQTQAERARQFGRTFEFVTLATLAAAGALLLAGMAGEVLNKPLAAVRASLASANAPAKE